MAQEHTKFKLFSKQYSTEESISQLLNEIETWVKREKVAPKSIGVEFLEKSNAIVMSLGYRDDENCNIKLNKKLIKGFKLDSDYQKIEEAMSEATKEYEHIICHELFITDTNDFHMIFMSQQ